MFDKAVSISFYNKILNHFKKLYYENIKREREKEKKEKKRDKRGGKWEKKGGKDTICNSFNENSVSAGDE